MLSRLFYSRTRSGGRSGFVSFPRRGGGLRLRLPFFSYSSFSSPLSIFKRFFIFSNKKKFFDFLFSSTGQIVFRPSTRAVLPGSYVSLGSKSSIFPGNRLPLFFIPCGTRIHSFSPTSQNPFSQCKKRFIISTSPGTSSLLLRRYSSEFALVRLPSGEQRIAHCSSLATIGSSSDLPPSFPLSKAGSSRMLGFRPRSRGVSMNPVDHPHGGRTRRGNPPSTPNFVPTRGFPTRSKKIQPYVLLSSRSRNFL